MSRLPTLCLRWVTAWTAVGIAWGVVVIGALTIGPFVLPAAALGTFLLLRHDPARPASPAVVAGLGAVPLYVAFLNRGGPGTVCTTTTTSQSCSGEMSPWPWVIVGLVLVGAAVRLLSRPRRTTRVGGPSET
jgi:hypothetical protein